MFSHKQFNTNPHNTLIPSIVLLLCVFLFTLPAKAINNSNNLNINVLSLVGESTRLWPTAFNKGLYNGLIHHDHDFTGNTITANLYGALGDKGLIKEQLEQLNTIFENRSIQYVTTANARIAQALKEAPDFLPFARRILLAQTPASQLDTIEVSDEGVFATVGARYEKSFESMLTLAKPDHVYVVGETTNEGSKPMSLHFKERIDRAFPSVKITYLYTQDVIDIIDTLAEAPANSAVYYLMKRRDSDNSNYRPLDSIKAIQKATTHLPVFSYWGPLTHEGSTGGYVISPEAWGRKVVDYIATYENGDLPNVLADDAFATIINDSQATRFGIDPDDLLTPYQLIDIQRGYLENNAEK